MKILFMILLSLTLVGADDFKIGLDAHNKEDYVKALKYYEKAVNKGVPAAAYNMGLIYDAKLHVFANKLANAMRGNVDADENYEKIVLTNKEAFSLALKSYKIAYEGGIEKSSYLLGQLYLEGVIIPFIGKVMIKSNLKVAKKWYTKAVQSQDKNVAANGELSFANLYKNGEYVLQDYTKAISHYKRAIRLGNSQSKCLLGEIYISQGKVSKAKKTIRSGYEDGEEYCSSLWTEHGLGIN